MNSHCLTQTADCKFLIKIIDSFTNLLDMCDGAKLHSNIKYESTVESTTTLHLSLKGHMMFIYGIVTGEKLPNHYTAADIKLINEIWDYLRHPENKIIL